MHANCIERAVDIAQSAPVNTCRRVTTTQDEIAGGSEDSGIGEKRQGKFPKRIACVARNVAAATIWSEGGSNGIIDQAAGACCASGRFAHFSHVFHVPIRTF